MARHQSADCPCESHWMMPNRNKAVSRTGFDPVTPVYEPDKTTKPPRHDELNRGDILKTSPF
jgi:hypothetical protein